MAMDASMAALDGPMAAMDGHRASLKLSQPDRKSSIHVAMDASMAAMEAHGRHGWQLENLNVIRI